ncbi:MAG TPA: DUF3089 domain-containing protein [Saprospiraceae bacterium]|nr:DUF3089 domain-containing protein [Saprospiraceae bacterium]HMQ81663.1 DUF3089 domain-containing protein [Saprospiraceae bacterium]
MAKWHLPICLGILFLLNQSCGSLPKGAFDAALVPAVPDYSDTANWAALPDKEDMADALLFDQLTDRQPDSPIDVFYIHPTSYFGQKGSHNWNAATDNAEVNARTDQGAIQFQASIFNGVGRVYAPRYRQGHIHLYFTKKDSLSAQRALDLAYEDVRRAFLYYWKHHNAGRPVILASHSQGTNHAERLIREFFDGQPAQQQLVAAYLVGMPIRKDAFANIPPCDSAEQTGCFMSWRTFKQGHEPKHIPLGDDILVTNPLNWTILNTYAPKSLNKGAVLPPFDEPYIHASDAQVQEGILWASKPRFKGSWLFNRKNYHIGDYNIYYMNVRENAQVRAAAYLGQRSSP